MSTRERIMMIRLMEKIHKHPEYALQFGVEATGAVNNQNMESNTTGLLMRELFLPVERRIICRYSQSSG